MPADRTLELHARLSVSAALKLISRAITLSLLQPISHPASCEDIELEW
jgi:hypothetical protein